jgi:hypothetical protein
LRTTVSSRSRPQRREHRLRIGLGPRRPENFVCCRSRPSCWPRPHSRSRTRLRCLQLEPPREVARVQSSAGWTCPTR